MACRAYRETHGVFAAAGILYNHESAHRPAHFLSSRLVDGALAVQGGARGEVVVARLGAQADWGYAPDYVDAMQAARSLIGDVVEALDSVNLCSRPADE